MLIDWFTVIAQVVNFLILVWLLKRFLYKPILNAIDSREKRIAKKLDDADAKKADAQAERDEFRRKNEAFEQQRAALLSEATEEVKVERERLLDEARKAGDAIAARQQKTRLAESKKLGQELSQLAEVEVFAIARKVLTELASTTLEKQMSAVFVRRLLDLDSEAKAALAHALKTASEPAVVRSAYELAADEREAIQNALFETFSTGVPIDFVTAADLICGIELSANGQKLAWCIKDYLKSLEKQVADQLEKTKLNETEAEGPDSKNPESVDPESEHPESEEPQQDQPESKEPQPDQSSSESPERAGRHP